MRTLQCNTADKSCGFVIVKVCVYSVCVCVCVMSCVHECMCSMYHVKEDVQVYMHEPASIAYILDNVLCERIKIVNSDSVYNLSCLLVQYLREVWY